MGAPVKNTCPDIDKVIGAIRTALKVAEKGRKVNQDDGIDDYFWDIIYELDGLDDKLEDLRKDNSALRDWGHDLDKELETAANTINDLENIIEELKLANSTIH